MAFAPRSTKEAAYKTLVWPKLEYAAPIWSPYSKLQINQVEKVQRTAAHWTCRRWRNTSSVGEMLDELEWPSLEARRDRSSLLLFHKIHSGAVSIEKDKYLTPARSLKSIRSSHSAQYCRYQTYSDALKNSFFPRTIPQWNSLSPSVVNSQTAHLFKKTAERFFFVLFLFCFCFVFVFSSKFQNCTPWRNDHNWIVPVLRERKKVYKLSSACYLSLTFQHLRNTDKFHLSLCFIKSSIT